MDKDRLLALQIAQGVDRAGGTAYFVGGCVRDALLGRESKDLELEIPGVSAEKLEDYHNAEEHLHPDANCNPYTDVHKLVKLIHG